MLSTFQCSCHGKWNGLLPLYLLLIFLFLTNSMPLYSQTVFYVAKNGSDTNPGTETAPFLTIARGLTVLGPGKTLYIKAGTYTEALGNDVPGGISWSDPVTLAAYPGDQVVIQPPPGSIRVFNPAGTDKCYIVFDGLILDGINLSDEVIKIDRIDGKFAHHIRLRNCEIKNSNGSGVLSTVGSSYNEFITCNIHHCRGTEYDHGLYICGSHNLVDSCLVHHNTGWGIHFYMEGPAEDSCHDNIARNNLCYDNNTSGRGGDGVGLYSGDNNIAYNNVCWGNAKGIATGNGSTNAQVYNNTVYGNTDSYGPGIYVGGERTVVRNNIAIVSSGDGVLDLGTGTIQDHNITSDPGFVDTAGHDFHLRSGSSAIDAGITLSLFTTDRDGVSRPQGAAWDAGAYEKEVNHPRLVVSPQSLDFGEVSVNSVSTLPVVIANDGNDTLRVNGIASQNPLFSVQTTAFVVAPGNSFVDSIHATGSATVGLVEGIAVIASNSGAGMDTLLLKMNGALTAVKESRLPVPATLALDQNYPNPFNPSTVIPYALPRRSVVQLTVYNALGQKVAELVNGEIDAGCHSVQFDASNLASGIYFYRLVAGNVVQTKTLLLVR